MLADDASRHRTLRAYLSAGVRCTRLSALAAISLPSARDSVFSPQAGITACCGSRRSDLLRRIRGPSGKSGSAEVDPGGVELHARGECKRNRWGERRPTWISPAWPWGLIFPSPLPTWLRSASRPAAGEPGEPAGVCWGRTPTLALPGDVSARRAESTGGPILHQKRTNARRHGCLAKTKNTVMDGGGDQLTRTVDGKATGRPQSLPSLRRQAVAFSSWPQAAGRPSGLPRRLATLPLERTVHPARARRHQTWNAVSYRLLRPTRGPGGPFFRAR